MKSFNNRVLIVDDERPVREGLREILGPDRPDHATLLEAEAALFGEDVSPAPSSAAFDFEVDTAANGMESLELVRGALAEKRPYALAFLDVRMPGWDGVETARRLRDLDPELGIVFITAFSDRSVEEIIERVGADVGYHCKPFQPAEIRQIATKGVHDWNRMRALEDMIDLAADMRSAPASSADLIAQVARRASVDLRAESVAIHRGPEQVLVRLGRFRDDEALADLQRSLREGPLDRPLYREDDVSFPLAGYLFTADLPNNASDRSERLFLLRLFAEQAGRSLEAVELRERLIRHEKLAALGQAMSKVVHDLRQPLAIQMGILDLFTRLPAEAAIGKDALQPLYQTVEDLADYLSDLADYAREPRLTLEPCSLEDALREVLDRLCHRDDSRAITLFSEPGVAARLDRPRFRRALLNLIINALEALDGRPDAAICIRALALGTDAVIRISDNGPGVLPELRQMLFEPFVTAGKHLGTGLGLAIARQLIEAHQGTLQLAASSPEGATFEVRLPLHR